MKNNHSDHSVYTSGSIRKTMLRTTMAMLAGTLAMSGYNIADAYFVGRLPGSLPLAAMGFTFPIIMLAGCLFRGLGIGIMTPMAHALGGSKREKAAKFVSYGFILVCVFSLLTAITGILFGQYPLALFGATGEALALSNEYMKIWFLGCLTASLLMTGNDVLIACGDNKTASAIMIVGMLINVAIDPIFIFGFLWIPSLGIKGAAIATVVSQMICCFLVWLLLAKRHQLLCFKNLDLRQMKGAWSVMIRFSIPACIGMLLMPAGSAVMTKITAGFGDDAVAAVAALGRLEMVAFVIPMAMGITLMPMIAQNYGAKQYDRIWECRRFAMRFAIFFLAIMGILAFCVAGPLSRQFSTVPEVQRILALGLRIIPWGLAGVEVHRFAGFFYTGCGHPQKGAWLNAMRIVGFLIPFSLIAAYYHSLPGLFVARLVTDLLAGVIGYALARHMTLHLKSPLTPEKLF